jgi:hypothetical protein
MRAAKAKCREKFAKPNQATPTPPPPPIIEAPKTSEPSKAPKIPKAMAGATGEVDYGEPPFLPGPQRATAEGKRRKASHHAAQPDPLRDRAPQHVQAQNGAPAGGLLGRYVAEGSPRAVRRHHPGKSRPHSRRTHPAPRSPRCRCPPEALLHTASSRSPNRGACGPRCRRQETAAIIEAASRTTRPERRGPRCRCPPEPQPSTSPKPRNEPVHRRPCLSLTA